MDIRQFEIPDVKLILPKRFAMLGGIFPKRGTIIGFAKRLRM